MTDSNPDAIVIGGGFFGCSLALRLASIGNSVLLLEKENALLARASFNNQARVHRGYHYPRSLLTGLRSRVNYPRFIEDYADCLFRFEQYYAIAASRSNVTAAQFKMFCDRIEAPLKPAPARVQRLFNPEFVQAVYLVDECAFDAIKLRNKLSEKLKDSGVKVLLQSNVSKILSAASKEARLQYEQESSPVEVSAKVIFNCTYSGINKILTGSELPAVAFKHEATEIALIRVPDALANIGVTMMCGPFFSFMPFPPRKLHSLSHVRYTPHAQYQEGSGAADEAPPGLPMKTSHYLHMIKDASRYMPILGESRYVESIWETKTVLPSSEVNDSRPILFHRSEATPRLISVMGGKIDNIYDMFGEVDSLLEEGIW